MTSSTDDAIGPRISTVPQSHVDLQRKGSKYDDFNHSRLEKSSYSMKITVSTMLSNKYSTCE
jgi:hypothetical protein